MDAVRFISADQTTRAHAIAVTARAIELAGTFLEEEGFPGTLEKWVEEFVVTIQDGDERYFIDLDPISGEGHDGQFAIHKATGELDRTSLTVGEVEPDPDEE